ncbi:MULTISPECIES: FAD binding domain-containing protein [unclassified Sedimentibacter]|uniref:FAD binding domain-containing protein n=1 Tax=unclassified Sedimentibacter TaxID=2649220 RepID=UPI0027DF66C8|nr:FAD binding domain-containing protein [Sedimentibacter sp. MB35-C1]WMJ78866.1 FAD binding domain-containing protein [Sedimentibacter sp. MB35-C1]
MFTIDKYIVAESLEQAFELNKNRRNTIIGGMLWLKMGRKRIGTAIDLSALGLNSIVEDEDSFRIGCMCTLREIETHEGLNNYFGGSLTKSVENIVGVQMRNLATIGGSIYSRFGFSDILTALLVLDTYVELFSGGVVSLEKYLGMPLDNDILVSIIIKKDKRKISYSSYRLSATDFPVLTCAVSKKGNKWFTAHGARPMKASLNIFELSSSPDSDEINKIISNIKDRTIFGTNMRASSEYRKILAGVLTKRGIEAILNGGNYAD